MGQVGGRIHQRDVTEGLWEIAHQPARARLVLLAEKSNVVAQREESLEELAGLVVTVEHGQRIREPEAAGKEGPFTGRQPVHPRLLGACLLYTSDAADERS